MLPETDFHKKRNLIFAIIENRYYNVSNSYQVNENYLNLCGLCFPLHRAGLITEEEKNYLKKNSEEIKKMKNQTEQDFNKGKGIESLTNELTKRENIHFFLSDICKPHNRDLKEQEYKPNLNSSKNLIFDDAELIFPGIISEDCVAINQRIYPLKECSEPLFVNINGKNYTIAPSLRTVDEAENIFQERLGRKIQIQAMRDSEKVNEIEKQISEIEQKNAVLEHNLKVKRYPYSYECNDLGFDTGIGCIYYLISPHSNYTTGKSYSEGQSAITLPLSKGVLGSVPKFAERNDRNQSFALSTQSHCLGISLNGNTLEDKMYFLRGVRHVIETNQAFYQVSQSSSSDDSSSDYQGY
ncbi:MAG: hypothetical protein WC781_01070 [Candidatus Pacearchaeota archaeon]|jgi:hypothetical protein